MMHVAALHHFLTPYLTHDVYLISTNLRYWLTGKKIIAAVVVVIAVIAVVVWFIRRRQTRTGSGV
jgi:hypothetical protein